jgi:hypothetical protein
MRAVVRVTFSFQEKSILHRLGCGFLIKDIEGREALLKNQPIFAAGRGGGKLLSGFYACLYHISGPLTS